MPAPNPAGPPIIKQFMEASGGGMSTPSEPTKSEVLAALDAFPNVMKKAQAIWGTKECDLFLQSLFMDTRGGTRKGFPMEAAEEIMFLVKFNKYVRALPLSQQLNIPIAEAFRIVDKADQVQLAESPWIDPNSSNEASVRQRPRARLTEQYQYQTMPRPARQAKKSGALVWVILLVLLALAYLLFYPMLKGGS